VRAETESNLVGESVGIILNSLESDHAFDLRGAFFDLVGVDGEGYFVFSHVNVNNNCSMPIKFKIKSSNNK
jgi:hypothetical protein